MLNRNNTAKVSCAVDQNQNQVNIDGDKSIVHIIGSENSLSMGSENNGEMNTGENARFKCTVCSWTCTKARLLDIHTFSHRLSKHKHYKHLSPKGSSGNDKHDDGVDQINKKCGNKDNCEDQGEKNNNKCFYCGFDAKTGTELASHTKEHTDIRQYKCKLCDHISRRQHDLQQHMKNEHSHIQ